MKTRYVYFDKETGMITDILNVKKRGRAKYIEVPLEDVMPILSGELGMMDLVVAYNTDQEKYVLLKRDNIIKLRYYGKDLYKIPNREMEDYDLRIDLFTNGSGIEISIDPSRMSTLYATDLHNEVEFEEGTELRIYLKNKEGKKTLRTFVIDAQRLLENGQVFYEFKDEIDPNDVSFYTHRVFANYMWRKSNTQYMSPSKNRLRFEIQKADLKKRSEKFDYHLIMKSTGKGIEIQNNIESVKLMRIFDDVDFYVVDAHDPTILHGKFTLNPKVFKDKTIIVPIEEDLAGKTILYNHANISVLIEG